MPKDPKLGADLQPAKAWKSEVKAEDSQGEGAEIIIIRNQSHTSIITIRFI